jgi:Spy/CpxP family protein refolding chaperone
MNIHIIILNLHQIPHMKNCIKIGFLFLFLFSAKMSAQYDDPGYRRYGGVDRSLTGQQHQGKKSKSNEKIDMVDESMKKLDTELSLDNFQSAVIRKLLEDNHVIELRIVDEDIPIESKTEKIIELRLKLNEKIKDILTPEQKEKLDNMSKKKKK